MKMRYYNRAAVLAAVAIVAALAIAARPGVGLGTEVNEPNEMRKPQDVQESLDLQELQNTQELQDVREPRDVQEPRESQDPWAKFEIILNRNIFSRQRGPIRRPDDVPDRRPVVIPNPESYFVLKGIVQEDGEFLAFIEDTRSSTVLRLRQGDAVAGGAIASLDLDGIEFQIGDRKVAVALGRNLEGGMGSGAVTVDQLMEWSDTASSTLQPSTAASEPSTSGGDADILKQLMERRKQQLGQ